MVTEKEKETNVTHTFFIAGVQYHQLKLCINELKVGDCLELVIETKEEVLKYDRNAVRIEHFTIDHESIMCGFVPKKFSSEVTASIAIGLSPTCKIIELNRNAKPWEQCKVEIREVT